MFLLPNSIQFGQLSVIMMKLWAPQINDVREKTETSLPWQKFVKVCHLVLLKKKKKSNLFHLDSLYEGKFVFENEKVLL